jgi:HrpA-like RNA helicase
MGFDFLDKPSEESMVRALELLYSLKAIDIDGNLTNDIGVIYLNILSF